MVLRSAVLLAVWISGCKSAPTLDGPCDPKQMASLRDALAHVDASDKAVITTIGLGEACEGKLPSGIGELIKALGSVNPADRATLIAGALEENPSFAKGGCTEWKQASQAAVQLEPGKRSAALYSGCHFERFELLTVAEFDQSWKAGGLALLAVPMYAWFVEKHMQPAEAKRLARSMFLGEELPAPPAPSPDEAQPR